MAGHRPAALARRSSAPSSSSRPRPGARSPRRRATPPTADQVGAITRPLFRALQFELRQRDVLATLGGLYYWFVPDGRKKALQWLEAAAVMGAEGRIARRLLEEARAASWSTARRWTGSARRRPGSSTTRRSPRPVRQALIEELGRFREFQPLLLDLQSAARARAARADAFACSASARAISRRRSPTSRRRKSGERRPPAPGAPRDYQQLIAGLDDSTGRIAEIERKLVQEFGKIVIS